MSAVDRKHKKNLYISISSHGYGHIGQMAPILNRLAFEHGDRINFTIQCGTSEVFLQDCFNFDFRHIDKSDDIGMLMIDSLNVQPQQSHRAYKEYHQHWPKAVMLKTREIERQRADAVISNISYLTIAAAKHLELPALALCSLNWAYIYLSYCGKLPGSDEIYQKALSHYKSADKFLIPTPGMPMSALGNETAIGPLARMGNIYPNFKKRIGVSEDTKLVLVSMGGIPYETQRQQWPIMENVVWLDAGEGCPGRRDIIPIKSLPFSFVDTLCNCDLVLTKPGYGMFTESTCNGIPVLYVPRKQWPEEPHLIKWLEKHNHCEVLSREDFENGQFAEQVAHILMQPKEITPTAPTGVGEACGHILEALGL